MSSTATIQRLARSGSLNVAGTIIGGGAGIALVVLVTNGVRQDVAGMLFAATSFFLIVAAVAGLGTDAGLAHQIQRHLFAGRTSDALATVGIALRAVAAVSVAMAAVVWFAAPWLAGVLGHDADPAAMATMLRVLALALPVATAFDTLLAATLAYGTTRPNVVIEKLGRMPGQILCVLGALLLDTGPTGLAIAWAVPYVFGLVAVGWWYRGIVVRDTGAAKASRPTAESAAESAAGSAAGSDATAATGVDRRPNAEIAREFWGFTAPRAVGRICQVALQRTDIVLVALLLSPGHAAVYTAATRFLAFGQLGIAAIQQVLAPQLSGLFARGDIAGVRDVFSTSTAWLMSMAWPIYLTSAVAAPVLLRVFGDGYAAGHATVVILSLTMLATTATGSVDVVLLMAGRSRQSLVNNALALVIDVVLVVVLVPRLGITGAALAWAVALAVRNVLPMLQVRLAYGVRSFGPGVAWVACSAGLCFGAAPLLLGLAVPLSLTTVVSWLPVSCLAYAGLLWRGRRVLQLDAFRAALPELGLRRRSARARAATSAGLAGLLRRLHGVPLPRAVRVGLSTLLLRRPGLTEVPLDRLLMGVQDGVPMTEYAERFDDLMWASTPVTRGPHAALLHLAAAAEPAAPSDAAILESAYGRHARRCLRLTGRYFWASDDHGIVEVARDFLARSGRTRDPGVRRAQDDPAAAADQRVAHRVGAARVARSSHLEGAADADAVVGESAPSPGGATGGGGGPAGRLAGTPQPGQSGPRDPVLVAPVRDSDCYQVLDGHHRLALLAHHGATTARVKVKRLPVSTPLQDLLTQMSWIGGRKELYQPVAAPELARSWTTVRRCTDRLELMSRCLVEHGVEATGRSYLDVASCYGWFVQEMSRRGFAAQGIERDPLAPQLGAAVYGLDPGQISVGDAVEFLRDAERRSERWDVVSCFSLLHHFVLGRASTSAEDLVRLLDAATARVLFLDTGQEHEAWFAHSLAGWDTARVGDFLREHSTFDLVLDLGADQDDVPPYAGNYGRHLFACVRTR